MFSVLFFGKIQSSIDLFVKFNGSIRGISQFDSPNFEGMLELSLDCWLFLVSFVALD